MPEEARRPLVQDEFVIALKKKDAAVGAVIGPDPFEAGEEELYLKPDPEHPTRMKPVENPMDAIQHFITLKPGQYAVIENPTFQFTEENVNGPTKSGRNAVPTLDKGKKRVVTSGHFITWPEQNVDIRNVHRLSTSEYLVVVVESEVDKTAPYYALTARCAKIRKAVVDETVAARDDKGNEAEGPDEQTVLGEQQPNEAKDKEAKDKKSKEDHAGPQEDPPGETDLTIGQRIIIPGNLTQIYIPPTGIEIVVEDEDVQVSEDAIPDKEIILGRINSGILKIENLREWLKAAEISEDYYNFVERVYTDSRHSGNYDTALSEALFHELESGMLRRLARTLRKAAIKQPKKDLAVRQAVVLGPTAYCVLLDEDGKPQIKEGPGRVFPGPYDQFRTEGSDDRVYQAYHLRGDRGILLRVVAEITKDELLKQLPPGSELKEPKDNYVKGDEIFIEGFDAYFVPFSAIEVINPRTRQPHIGNKHSDAYSAAIGVDQKSGIYVANVQTGNIQLVKGEVRLILDPRKQEQVNRIVPAERWNLIIGHGEPHKKQSAGTMVKTPWALSVIVPNNEAILIIGKGGRRAVVGPCMELLEYDEWLEVLTLSKGKRKSEDDQLETCFLRVTGNRISDTIDLETSDFIKIQVQVSYGVDFIGDTDQEREKWFDYKDYVMLLANNMRSRLRAAARKKTLIEIYQILPDFVRDTVLGEKHDGEERKGHFFKENNMMVTEVEVLPITIPDYEVAKSLELAHQKIVTFQINEAANQAELQSVRSQAEIDKEKADIELAKIKRDECIKRARAVSISRLDMEAVKRESELRQAQSDFEADLRHSSEEAETLLADMRRARKEEDAKSDLTISNERREQIVGFKNRLSEIQNSIMEAAAKADVDRLKAIQPGLVEAIEGLGDKQALAKLAEYLPPASGELGLALGAGGIPGLMRMLENTPFGQALKGLSVTTNEISREIDTAEQQIEE